MKTLYIVGIGPGDKSGMTLAAEKTIQSSDVIVGYRKYLNLIQPYYPEKEYYETGMTEEAARCRAALTMANEGSRVVAMVCSGDAGVYGMAGLVYELSREYPEVDIKVIPGVTAALSGGALLGAPLGHDFTVISLSDRLTPWPLIEKRLICAAQGDFCICLYNPASHARPDYLQKACDILLSILPPTTVCGIAGNIGREGEKAETLTLEELRGTPADMFTTVFIGNSSTQSIGGKMVAPRGYRDV